MKHNILVFSSLFPSSAAPNNGLFIWERMSRVARHANLIVVSPVPWFPGQQLFRVFKNNYRPQPEKREEREGITVYYPRFFSFPGVLRNLDGLMMYLCCFSRVKKLCNEHKIEIIDSHFTYPDGLAATWLARKLGLKAIITLRGTEIPHSRIRGRQKQLIKAWRQADRIFAVSNSLREHAVALGAKADKCTVIGNGIDTEKFQPVGKAEARARLQVDADAQVLITVGGLIERKGFHRVVACMPELLQEFPKLVYLVVGGANAEGDYKAQISALAERLNVTEHVQFLGALKPEELRTPLSAADVFVLPSSNEGWANVILEAMACGIPVVATDVGGNAEVVKSTDLGDIVPFGDHRKLLASIRAALLRDWNTAALTRYAEDNHWDNRIRLILAEYDQLESSPRPRQD